MKNNSSLKVSWLNGSVKKPFRAVDDAPFVVFVLTLLMLAITCSVLSYFVIFMPIPNPQVRDWSSFLDRFRRLEICLESNSDDYQKSALDAKFRDFAILKPHVKNETNNVAISLFLRFETRNIDWFCSQNATIFLLSFEVNPKKIGLLAEDASKNLRVGFILTHNQFETACRNSSTRQTNITLTTCVYLSGSSTFLPTKGHREQCLNDQDPAVIFSNGSSPLHVFRPLIATHVVKDSVLGELGEGSERRVCSKGGILASPTFISDGDKDSLYLPPEICRLISYRLLMAALILLLVVPVFAGIAHLCRKCDNSHLVSSGQVTPVSYSPVKVKSVD